MCTTEKVSDRHGRPRDLEMVQLHLEQQDRAA
jgi:hypothetical protein